MFRPYALSNLASPKDCFASPVRGCGTESLSGVLIQPLDRFGHCKGGFSGARGRCAQPLGVVLGSRLSGLYHRLRARSRGEQPRGIQDERELRCHMMEPANTGALAVISRGIDSPVMLARSTNELGAVTVPSDGMRPIRYASTASPTASVSV